MTDCVGPRLPRRIRVLGATGAGKTTFARKLSWRLGVPALELDAVFWGENWSDPDPADGRRRIREFLAGPGRDGWIADGDWQPQTAGAFDDADTIVWLDYPRHVTVFRAARRTVARALTRRPFWAPNIARMRTLFSSPADSVVTFSYLAVPTYHAEYARQADHDPRVVRMGSPRQAAAWLRRPVRPGAPELSDARAPRHPRVSAVAAVVYAVLALACLIALVVSYTPGSVDGHAMPSASRGFNPELSYVAYWSHGGDATATAPAGQTAPAVGTNGQAGYLAALTISEPTDTPMGVGYQAYVGGTGWQEPVVDGQLTDTTSDDPRVAAIKIWLTGDYADRYDVRYRVHTPTFGWLAWTGNGQAAGTSGLKEQIDAIQIQLDPAGTTPSASPESDDAYFWHIDSAWHMPAGTWRIGDATYRFDTPDQPGMIEMDTGTVNQDAIGAYQGCELVALYNGLVYLSATGGQSPDALIDAFPRADDPDAGFDGDPRSADTAGFPDVSYQTWPSAVVAFTIAYAPGTTDVSGSSADQLAQDVLGGAPVLVWATVGFDPPQVANPDYDGRLELTNNHTVLVDGFDRDTDQFHINDPSAGSYWIDESKLAAVYGATNRFAVLLAA